MRYLAVRNFWKYQNADVWKKSRGHPPWFKFYVHRDLELDLLPPVAKLLWYEILACATRYTNVILNDSEWLSHETRIAPEQISEYLPVLLRGRWLSQTNTPRRTRSFRESVANHSRNIRDLKEEIRLEEDTPRAVDSTREVGDLRVVHSPRISSSHQPKPPRTSV